MCCKHVGYVWITWTCSCSVCGSSWPCGRVHVGTEFMPSCLHIHTQTCWLLSDITRQLFFSWFSITPPPSMNEGLVRFFLQLSAVRCYPGFALCFLAWTHSCFFLFFNLTLTEEMISDWREERQTNISYLWTRLRSTRQTNLLPTSGGCCQV